MIYIIKLLLDIYIKSNKNKLYYYYLIRWNYTKKNIIAEKILKNKSKKINFSPNLNKIIFLINI